MKKIVLMAMVVMFVFVGCKSKEKAVEESLTDDNTTKEESAMTEKTWSEPKEVTIDATKNYVAIIHTSKGDIECDLFEKDAPLSVTNFKYLADGGFYNGLTFHRVVPQFVVQGGDPDGTGAGGPGYTIPAEINAAHKHTKGALAWARTADQAHPERRSSGSQFYITLEPTPFLDGQYTVFGQTLNGEDVVAKIQMGDTIESIEVVEK